MLLTQHEMPFGMKLRRTRSEIKFDLNMRSIFHIPLGIFHSEAISLDEVEFHCKTQVFRLAFYMAEAEGFEPPRPFGQTVFKTAPL